MKLRLINCQKKVSMVFLFRKFGDFKIVATDISQEQTQIIGRRLKKVAIIVVIVYITHLSKISNYYCHNKYLFDSIYDLSKLLRWKNKNNS